MVSVAAFAALYVDSTCLHHCAGTGESRKKLEASPSRVRPGRFVGQILPDDFEP